MKSILVLVSFYHVFNIISATETFNSQSNDASHSISSQQVNHLNNITSVPHHTISHSNSSHPQQVHPHNVPITTSYSKNSRPQLHNRPKNLLIHPKFRPASVQDGEMHHLLSVETTTDSTLHTTKSSSLLQILTDKPIENDLHTRRRLSFADYYYQQQLKAFFGHHHEKFPPHTRSNIKTGL
ncbi:hypothetical protein I4U23_012401 [Adineta vaga]|nr:hypothetical protein I4U23_012401 [Adineta vaga]